ncbi:MAG TPA: PHP domain-containing protein [Firmicutes bacterium]|nr:PHP domain-containing protein [Bacillota bacterium]
MTKFPVDLHVHTTISDGTFSPRDIISQAKNLGLKGIAITDHDSVGEPQTLETIINSGFCIPGLELSSLNNNVHILAYGLNWNCPKLKNFLNKQQQHRMNALIKMCEKSKQFNVPVEVEEVLAQKNGDIGAIGRPHIAAVMLEKGYVSSIRDAFNRYLRKGAPIYEKKERHTHSYLISKVIEWGAMPVLAHPGLIEEHIRNKIINESIEAGISGIEVYYPLHSEEYTRELIKFAGSNSLIITGGSDFHGTNKPQVSLGMAGINEQEFKLFLKELNNITGFELKT